MLLQDYKFATGKEFCHLSVCTHYNYILPVDKLHLRSGSQLPREHIVICRTAKTSGDDAATTVLAAETGTATPRMSGKCDSKSEGHESEYFRLRELICFLISSECQVVFSLYARM